LWGCANKEKGDVKRIPNRGVRLHKEKACEEKGETEGEGGGTLVKAQVQDRTLGIMK